MGCPPLCERQSCLHSPQPGVHHHDTLSVSLCFFPPSPPSSGSLPRCPEQQNALARPPCLRLCPGLSLCQELLFPTRPGAAQWAWVLPRLWAWPCPRGLKAGACPDTLFCTEPCCAEARHRCCGPALPCPPRGPTQGPETLQPTAQCWGRDRTFTVGSVTYCWSHF